MQYFVCLAFAVGILSSCHSAADQSVEIDLTDDCLSRLAIVSTEFDRRYDRVNRGGSYSCLLGVNARTVQKVLSALKTIVLYDDEAAADEALRFPVKVNIGFENNSKQELWIDNWTEWLVFRNEHFRPEHIALILCSSTTNLDIIPSDGAMIGNGFVWLNGELDEFGVGVINMMLITDEQILSTCKAH